MEFEQILKLVDLVSASHLESFCYESDGVKLTLNNKIAPVIIPGTMQNNILSGAETGEKGFVFGEKYSISEQAPDRKIADKELSEKKKKQAYFLRGCSRGIFIVGTFEMQYFVVSKFSTTIYSGLPP